jgi:membrane protease YdiL (CAAX protease family)
MDDSQPGATTRLALLFEGGLGAAALAIGWLVGHSPLVGLGPETGAQQVAAIGWGLVATGPLLVALLVLERLPFAPLRRLQEMATAILLRMFRGASIGQLAVVALAAGFGEELLFRGLVQAGLSRWLMGMPGQVTAVLIAAVLFGVCHWLSATYAVLAMLAGVYFGALLAVTDNILAPITAHAVYDFLALVYLVEPTKMLGSKE